MSSFSSSTAFASPLESLSLPPQLPPIATADTAEQLCYVHCHFCDTVLAVSVPASSLFKTVTVRCGHCGALLAVNTTGLLFPGTATATTTTATITTTTATPPAAQSTSTRHGQSHFCHSLILDEVSSANPIPSLLHALDQQSFTTPTAKRAKEPSPRTCPAFDRPPEKRQRVPSAYNRFIKDEIQRIKAGNPEISHREAFSAAAKNWAHFPHIHFGLMPDHQSLKKTSFLPQDHQRKDGIYTAMATNMGVAPF